MKSIYKTILLAITPILFLSSCSESDEVLDTTKPEIILGLPQEHQEYEFGGEIKIQAILKDNVELGAYKIDIHTDGDGHQHRTSAKAWEFSDSGVIKGKREYQLEKTIQIPEGEYLEGHYHLGIIVTDTSGNETQSFIEIVIGDDHHH